MTERWHDLVREKKLRQQAAIPQAWVVSSPSSHRLDVLEFPKETGLLSALEVEITESDVEVLLPKLASGSWSAVAVTTAFYKRAIIAHQAVCQKLLPGVQCNCHFLGELSYRNFC